MTTDPKPEELKSLADKIEQVNPEGATYRERQQAAHHLRAYATDCGKDLLAQHEALKSKRDAAIKEANRRDQKWMDGINAIFGRKLDYGDPCSPNAASSSLESFKAQHEAWRKVLEECIQVLEQVVHGPEKAWHVWLSCRDKALTNARQALKENSPLDNPSPPGG